MVRTSPGVTCQVLHTPGVTAFMYPPTPGRKSPPMVCTSPGVTCPCYMPCVPPDSDPMEGSLPQWYVPPQVLHTACNPGPPGVTRPLYP